MYGEHFRFAHTMLSGEFSFCPVLVSWYHRIARIAMQKRRLGSCRISFGGLVNTSSSSSIYQLPATPSLRITTTHEMSVDRKNEMDGKGDIRSPSLC